MAVIANVSLADSYDLQRIKLNQTIKIVNDIELGVHPLANTVQNAANIANSVANSAGNLAYNLVVTDPTLVARITDAANTVIIESYTDIYDDSNASFLRANAALLTSNTAMEIANIAYDTANTFVANAANIIADVILDDNTTQDTINAVATIYITNYLANVDFTQISGRANTALIVSNSIANIAIASFSKSNTTSDVAIAAFAQANSGLSQATSVVFTRANSALVQANTARNHANASFEQANVATYVFNQSNTLSSILQSAYGQANTAASRANDAGSIANAAFNKANTGASGANVAIVNDVSTDQSFYITMTRSTLGNISNLTTSQTKLYYNPSEGTLTSFAFNSLSDENIKKDVERISNALELIEKIDGVNFTWKDSNVRSSGVIAQNLVNVVPHLVKANEVKELTVNYNGLSALLIEAIKELNREVKAIKEKVGL